MTKTKVTLIITMTNGHVHKMTGWSYDIVIEKDYIRHMHLSTISGSDTHDFVVNMHNVLYYEEYRERVEVNK